MILPVDAPFAVVIVTVIVSFELAAAQCHRYYMALEQAPRGLTIAGITRSSGLPRTTVARLVTSLQTEQFVSVAGCSVRLGPALLRLAAAARVNAMSLARPHMERLATELRENVNLWVERADWVELVGEVASDQEVRIVRPLGFRLPLTTSAPGKAFLAGLSDAEIARRIAGRLEARTPRSLATLEALLADVAEARRRGVSVDLEEHSDDICAAARVVDLGLPAGYALAVPAPARLFRAARERLEAALAAAVAAIEAG